jgi:hypothetical protein
MGIEIFEKTYTGSIADTVRDLLHDAGFSDVTNTVSGTNVDFSSASGVYGCKSFSIYNYSSAVASKFVAIKDDSRKALIVLPEFTGNTITAVPAYYIVALVIVDGVTTYFDASDLSKWTNVIGGNIKSSTDSSDVLLAPLIDTFTHVFSPFYVSLNRVIHPINTVVTDGSNSFTSLGNLFYIKNA